VLIDEGQDFDDDMLKIPLALSSGEIQPQRKPLYHETV